MARGNPDDHERDVPRGHDITEEGLHRVIYRDGEKIRWKEISPPIPVNDGIDTAEGSLREIIEG